MKKDIKDMVARRSTTRLAEEAIVRTLLGDDKMTKAERKQQMKRLDWVQHVRKTGKPYQFERPIN